MDIVIDKFGRKIRLTDERWEYIVSHHPEMKELRKKFEDALKEPETIIKSVYGSEVVLYYRYYKEILKGKYIVWVVKINMDSFVLTGYVTDRIKEGEAIWKKD